MLTAPTTPGRRELNRSRTRRAIITATRDLVAEFGFGHVTIEMIAESAEVSPRTFNNYFAGKQDALFANEPELLDVILGAFADQPAELPVLPVLRAVLEAMAADVASRSDEFAVRVAILHDNPELLPAFHSRLTVVEQAVADQIARRLGEPGGKDDRRPHLLAGLAGSVWRASVERWRAGDRVADLPGIVTGNFDLLLETLHAETARARS